MKIGNLRHRVELQTYKEAQDAYHGTYTTWTTIRTLSAAIESVKGYITFDTQQINETITHKIMIRFQPDLVITSENWLLMNSRRFRIRNVQNLFEKERFLVLLCEEVFHAQQPFETGLSHTGDPLIQDLPADN